MSRRGISIFNCFLSIIIFLCFFGNACYRAALPNKGGSDFNQQVSLCFYFAFFVIVSIYCICVSHEESNKPYKIASIYTAIFPVIALLLSFVTLIRDDWTFEKIEFPYMFAIVLPPIISGLFLKASFIKDWNRMNWYLLI